MSETTQVKTAIVRRKARILIEMPLSLKSRLDAVSFETQLPVAEIARYALWGAAQEAEVDPEKFVMKVAAAKVARREAERIK
jgi:hypothetical protein